MFPIMLRKKRTGIVGIRNATNNTTGSAKMPGWRRSCLRISSLGWKSENGFMVLAGFALLHGEDFHDFVAEVVDDFYRDAAGGGLGEWAGDGAVQGFPGFLVYFRL